MFVSYAWNCPFFNYVFIQERKIFVYDYVETIKVYQGQLYMASTTTQTHVLFQMLNLRISRISWHASMVPSSCCGFQLNLIWTQWGLNV
jgi:hypothetical protein